MGGGETGDEGERNTTDITGPRNWITDQITILEPSCFTHHYY
jgi:hypothetical protein